MNTAGPHRHRAGSLAIAILFPICRSELLQTGGDPSELRLLLDRDITSGGISSSLVSDLSDLHLPGGRSGCPLLLEVAELAQARSSPSALRSAIESMVLTRMSDQPTPIVRRLARDFEEADAVDVDPSDLMVKGTLVGQQIEEAVFLADVDEAGLSARQAIELDCASRMLPWFDRFDKREKRTGGAVLRAALRSSWDVVSGRGDVSQAAKIDRALQREFVDTSRYGDSDWAAWFASKAADAVYTAVGYAFERPQSISAVGESRSIAIELSAINRGMVPWQFEAPLVTDVDQIVIEELRTQLSALARVQADPLALRPADI